MEYEKKGYLTSYFKLFRLKDIAKLNVKAHYHEFDKIILFLSGKVNYVIEAQSYQLFPYDIVFLDPPYAYDPADVLGFVQTLVEKGRLSSNAVVSYEHDASTAIMPYLGKNALDMHILSTKRFGGTAIDLLGFESD